MRHILDPQFVYRPSYATDVRQTFERARREHERHEKNGDRERGDTPLGLMKAAAAGRRFP